MHMNLEGITSVNLIRRSNTMEELKAFLEGNWEAIMLFFENLVQFTDFIGRMMVGKSQRIVARHIIKRTHFVRSMKSIGHCGVSVKISFKNLRFPAVENHFFHFSAFLLNMVKPDSN